MRVAEHFVEDGACAIAAATTRRVDHQPVAHARSSARSSIISFRSTTHGRSSRLPFAAAAAAVKLSQLLGISKAFDTMLARGAFVKVGDDLYRGSQIAEIRARVETHLRERTSV